MKEEKVIRMEQKIKEDHNNITGMVIQKDGEIIYENYFHKCTAKSKVHVYSVTKSIVSILIGIAIDQDYIQSVNQNVLDFFPDYTVKRREKTIQNVTLENLLTMTAPYKYIFAPYIKYFTSDDYLKFTLDLLGGKGRIGEFRYTPLIGPDILSGILKKSTGKSVLDFATENLFLPLEIAAPGHVMFQNKEEQISFNKATNINGWSADLAGVNTAGWGLTLSPLDMAKIGQLYLNGGRRDGEQIVSEKWIEESTKEHSRWKKRNLSYGYLWWIVDEKEHAYAAMGDGGNVIYFNREKKIVVSIAALFAPRVKDRIELIKEYVEPICE